MELGFECPHVINTLCYDFKTLIKVVGYLYNKTVL